MVDLPFQSLGGFLQLVEGTLAVLRVVHEASLLGRPIRIRAVLPLRMLPPPEPLPPRRPTGTAKLAGGSSPKRSPAAAGSGSGSPAAGSAPRPSPKPAAADQRVVVTLDPYRVGIFKGALGCAFAVVAVIVIALAIAMGGI